MSTSGARILLPSDIAQATAELILALQAEFPFVRIIACDSIEGEDIHLEAHINASTQEEIQAAQDRAISLKQMVEDKYGVYALVRVVSDSTS
jgi:hypothetical protein